MSDYKQIELLYREVKEHVMCQDTISTSAVQRRFRLGWVMASRILDRLEGEGVVGPSLAVSPRVVLKRHGGDE